MWENKDDKEPDYSDMSDVISEEYKIEVELISEKEQEQVYNDLIKKGYKCRILTF